MLAYRLAISIFRTHAELPWAVFFAGFILLNFFAYSETLLIAGAINLAVAGLAYQFIYREQYA